MLIIYTGVKASDVEVASTAKADELGRSARSRNSPADGKVVSRGPLVIISRSAQKWRFVLLPHAWPFKSSLCDGHNLY